MKVFQLSEWQCTVCGLQLKGLPNVLQEVIDRGRARMRHPNDGDVQGIVELKPCPHRREEVWVPIAGVVLELAPPID